MKHVTRQVKRPVSRQVTRELGCIGTAAATTSPRRTRLARLRSGESGEGVISTAIAVLIMAFIGAAMWVVFNNVFQDASGKVEQQVDEIGQN